jgi:hypothetical protein
VGVTTVDSQGSGGWEGGSTANGRDMHCGKMAKMQMVRVGGWEFERWSGQGGVEPVG